MMSTASELSTQEESIEKLKTLEENWIRYYTYCPYKTMDGVEKSGTLYIFKDRSMALVSDDLDVIEVYDSGANECRVASSSFGFDRSANLFKPLSKMSPEELLTTIPIR